MAQFVMVISQVTSEQFEKIISIQVRSGDKIKFYPQSSSNHSVTSPNLSTTNQGVTKQGVSTTEQLYQNVRLEFTDEAVHFAREIYDLFVKKSAEAQKAG